MCLFPTGSVSSDHRTYLDHYDWAYIAMVLVIQEYHVEVRMLLGVLLWVLPGISVQLAARFLVWACPTTYGLNYLFGNEPARFNDRALFMLLYAVPGRIVTRTISG